MRITLPFTLVNTIDYEDGLRHIILNALTPVSDTENPLVDDSHPQRRPLRPSSRGGRSRPADRRRGPRHAVVDPRPAPRSNLDSLAHVGADRAAGGVDALAAPLARLRAVRLTCSAAPKRPVDLGPPDRGWILALPKAEVHVHLEGCIDETLVNRASRRAGATLPDGLANGGTGVPDLAALLRLLDWCCGPPRSARRLGCGGVRRGHAGRRRAAFTTWTRS